ncbi:MAG: hypothetical protein ACP5PX_08320 [Candidatus Hadarchaeum sp.]|uniref:hypothetical protein n=1 Tax=Candidatus Hadarchaeum sp. TaxID=2883567 RepID=UPI003D0B3CED
MPHNDPELSRCDRARGSSRLERDVGRLSSIAVLPRPIFDEEAALVMLRQIQQANHRAYLSHRKRTLQKLKIEDT